MAVKLGAAALAVAGLAAFAMAHRPPPAPVQPVAFSHAHHVTETGLDCRFCHYAVETAPAAGLPHMEICAGCHWPVETRPAAEPLIWRRVASLPDHSFFDHSIHVAGGIDCATCHGDVARMERVSAPAQAWTMLWCLECHRAQPAQAQGNTRLTHCYTCHR